MEIWGGQFNVAESWHFNETVGNNRAWRSVRANWRRGIADICQWLAERVNTAQTDIFIGWADTDVIKATIKGLFFPDTDWTYTYPRDRCAR